MLSLYLGLFHGRKVECKCYNCDRKGFPDAPVTGLKGKVSNQSGVYKYHQVTSCNKSHTRDLLVEAQEGSYLCWGEKQQGTEQETS